VGLTQGIALDAALAFALASVLIELTPGPNMAYLALVAATEGRRTGFATVAGVALGLTIVGLATALGLSAIISASPLAFQALRWGGVAYLLWLAWDCWRSADALEDHATPGQPLNRYFRRGLITNLLNPKAAVFYVAVLPGFITPAAPVAPQAVSLSLIFVAVATSIHAAIVTLAGSAAGFLNDPRRSRIARHGFSFALAGVAVWFAWKTQV
jgi:threonine/homoserine/homoserine lactone efflux protein